MSKFKGGRSKAVEDGWVDHVTVLVAVSVTEGKDVRLVHIVCSQYYWQLLVIHDVRGKGHCIHLQWLTTVVVLKGAKLV